mgnify:CR=1 FL=1
MAKTAERGCFAMIFLADNPAVREAAVDAISRSAQYIAGFEPIRTPTIQVHGIVVRHHCYRPVRLNFDDHACQTGSFW